MDKTIFLNTLKSFRDDDYNTQVYQVKAYLLTHHMKKDAFKTNNEACETEKFLEENYLKQSWEKNKTHTIDFNKVIGGSHGDYENQSPIQMIINEAKRMKRIFYYLAENPEYYFNSPVKEHNDPISYVSYQTRTNKEQLIAYEGNHRTAMGRLINSIFGLDGVKINNVHIIKYELDYELIDLIEQVKKNLSEYGYKFHMEKNCIFGKSCCYKLITKIVIYNNKNEYRTEMYFRYDENDLELSVINNIDKIKRYLGGVIEKLPKKSKVLKEFKSFKNSTANLITSLFEKKVG